MKIKTNIFELLPFGNYVIEDLISQKTVSARGFKLGQLIEFKYKIIW